jgi:hypothetical protein
MITGDRKQRTAAPGSLVNNVTPTDQAANGSRRRAQPLRTSHHFHTHRGREERLSTTGWTLSEMVFPRFRRWV